MGLRPSEACEGDTLLGARASTCHFAGTGEGSAPPRSVIFLAFFRVN
jgi:hypothetical protein